MTDFYRGGDVLAVRIEITFDGTPEQYDEINEKIDVENNPPDGFIIHTGAEVDGKMSIVDVWDSAEQFGAFAESTLGQTIAEVMGDDAPAVEPKFTELRTVTRA
jgi:hypothetical protein